MTRIAIISDIHANLVALETVLTDLDSAKPDHVVCLGDVAATGPAPAGVIERLRSRAWDFVRGNCDDALIRYAAGAGSPPADEHDAIDKWCAESLSSQDLLFVTSFKPVVTITIDEVTLCCYHGSPRSNLDEILPNTGDHEIERWFRGFPATIYAGGHTHVQMYRRYQEGIILNPGSVGLPFSLTKDGDDFNPLVAEYAIVTIDGGELAVEFRRIPVDATAIAAMADSSEMPHAGWWRSDWR